MAGIYIHIPFCKQACHYCDFHFSTSLKKKDDLIKALQQELKLRQAEFENITVETIYFGGGTPSILSPQELDRILKTVHEYYTVSAQPEITLEANPDDLTEHTERVFKEYKAIGISRLSIGIQSFFEADLKLMNRAHNATEAKQCLEKATQYFDNISIDLIYGIPGASNAQWLENIDIALGFNIPHISSYALTVEPKTALETFIKKGVIANVDDDKAEAQFHILINRLQEANFIHYELSNFGKAGFFSKNNSAYWQGKPYIGIGPSAHSFYGTQRSWNINNNSKYIKALAEGKRPCETETLSIIDRYNEYVMTGLRTIWGVSLPKVETDFGALYKSYLLEQAQVYINDGLLQLKDNVLSTTQKGKFLCDGIASHLFRVV